MNFVLLDSAYKKATEYGRPETQATYDVADYIIKHDSWHQFILSNKVNYWIIELKKDSLVGPLSKSEYIAKRKDLSIPMELRLQFEKEIK